MDRLNIKNMVVKVHDSVCNDEKCHQGLNEQKRVPRNTGCTCGQYMRMFILDRPAFQMLYWRYNMQKQEPLILVYA